MNNLTENKNPYLEAALRYARLGLYVFPAKPRGKAPNTPHGFKDSTRSEEQIVAWWNECPSANVAIATGQGYSNLLVLDIDVDPEKKIQGDQALKDLENKHGKIPKATWTAKTGRGGTHYIYSLDHVVPNSVSKIAPGIDTRSEGGYIIVPPSLHPNGKYYTWITSPSDSPLAKAPDILISLLKEPQRESHDDQDTEENEGFKDGSRNNKLFTLGIRAHKDGATPEALWQMLYKQNQAGNPPVESKELRAIYESILKYEKNKIVDTTPIALQCLAEVEEQTPEWLIDGYIPKYTITTLAGDGGSGKTTLWCNIASGISSGTPSVFEESDSMINRSDPCKIIFFSSEDSANYTLVGRLKSNGAILDNISHIPLERDDFNKIKFSSKELEQIIKSYRPDLVIFDPLQGFLDHGTQMSQRNHMREELNNVSQLCAKYKTTALIVMHTNKSQKTSGRGRMADSADIWDVARSCLIVGYDPETGFRYVSQEKSNYSLLSKTILFSIEDKGEIKYEGNTVNRDKEFQESKFSGNKSAPKRDEAKKDIADFLKKEGGIATVKDLDDYMLQICGYSKDVLRRAKSALRAEEVIITERPKEFQGAWSVRLWTRENSSSIKD